jgi:hypothetical protein
VTRRPGGDIAPLLRTTERRAIEGTNDDASNRVGHYRRALLTTFSGPPSRQNSSIVQGQMIEPIGEQAAPIDLNLNLVVLERPRLKRVALRSSTPT